MKVRSTQSREGVKGKISPCRVKGQRPLWGLGQRPNCFSGAHSKRTANKGAGSEASLPVTLRFLRSAPKLLFPASMLCRAKWARPNCWSCGHNCSFPKAGVSRLRARVGGFAVALDTPSQRSPMRLDFYRNISLRICRCNHALPQWICGCLKKGAGKAKWN